MDHFPFRAAAIEAVNWACLQRRHDTRTPVRVAATWEPTLHIFLARVVTERYHNDRITTEEMHLAAHILHAMSPHVEQMRNMPAFDVLDRVAILIAVKFLRPTRNRRKVIANTWLCPRRIAMLSRRSGKMDVVNMELTVLSSINFRLHVVTTWQAMRVLRVYHPQAFNASLWRTTVACTVMSPVMQRLPALVRAAATVTIAGAADSHVHDSVGAVLAQCQVSTRQLRHAQRLLRIEIDRILPVACTAGVFESWAISISRHPYVLKWQQLWKDDNINT